MAVAADDYWRGLADVDCKGTPGPGRTDAGLGKRLLTPLEKALRERIRAEGSVTVEAYMEACNAYYYATRDPFGPDGDFVTAPEISQMFGEIVGAALADCWDRAGRPADAAYCELGPGRGTLAADAVRVLRKAGFDGPVHCVETSPMLREAQSRAIPDARFHDSIDELPAVPLLVVANEFFDALPVRQFVGGIERKLIAAAGGLAFDRDGEVTEVSPVRDEVAAALAARLVANGGAALVIDYGHERTAPGDTLQAVRSHDFAPVLVDPGEQDLTAHVDFQALASAATGAGAAVTPLATQGEWLGRLGIVARARALSKAQPDRADEISATVHRLTDATQMGRLFKVMAIHSPDWPAPAGFE